MDKIATIDIIRIIITNSEYNFREKVTTLNSEQFSKMQTDLNKLLENGN